MARLQNCVTPHQLLPPLLITRPVKYRGKGAARISGRFNSRSSLHSTISARHLHARSHTYTRARGRQGGMGDAGYGGWNPRNDRSGSPESCGCLARATRNISPRSFARTKSERAPLRWGVIYVAEGGNCPRILCPACPRGHTFHPAVSMVNNVPRVVHLNDSSCLQLFWQLIARPPFSLVEIYRVSSLSFQLFIALSSSCSYHFAPPNDRKETLHESRVFHLF